MQGHQDTVLLVSEESYAMSGHQRQDDANLEECICHCGSVMNNVQQMSAKAYSFLGEIACAE